MSNTWQVYYSINVKITKQPNMDFENCKEFAIIMPEKNILGI
jgi:hypothetical protein